MKPRLRRAFAAISLATAAVTGTAVANDIVASPRDTTWGSPDTTDDTTWGTPPVDDGDTDTTLDTTWG